MGLFVGAAFAVQAYGIIKGNKDKAKAAKANAAYYELQRQHALREKRRAMDVFKTQSTQFIGQKITSIAKAGVSLSGSALMDLAMDKAAIGREADAIATQADVNARLAGMKASAANKQASSLTNPFNMALQIGGQALNSYAMYKSLNAGSGSGGDGGILPGLTPDGGYSGPIIDSNAFGGL